MSSRDRASWMTRSDDIILEQLANHGNLVPLAVERLSDAQVKADTVSEHFQRLEAYGLVENIADVRGLYGLTDKGRAYLDGDLDASTLQPEGGPG